ncbi:GMP synthase [glutamine-hydrolyzing] [Aliiroseovarius sp. xm-m-379]|uniref:Type 1 glutamine amidotransferase n=1 Tax=Aliiroseovarius crassostreae TaxID=154981 RepID=A0A9Q9HBT3_9RHOB|nr:MULTISPECIES: type 1 glutamine amidotransferase [Aliiroseovarius]NRP24796.1 GMP synthase [glutamine-hydrolyzing] [Aliiroseovarius sp. xm-m-379]NRP30569.1 GMP synthase [glutamine-hydrolyzing] [Aliiroseovarius sp. xm-m-314]NRP33595.1 GMP synthase [glutamine-hydrolyzing] [Aliiroseovarius sp. xm-a-104]NRP44483.1 GMP synthase [glutamine-hydrolyzing] [Aliiroseovarius sp. xm-m-378]NRP50272.1 GMP synthase [glutamine-hydrolyzing] [Aliiroseovarius sp. xm-m-354]
MKIGILQAGHSPDEVRDSVGNYGEMFTRLLDGHGFEFEIFSVVDGEFPPGIDAADGWLITGSKHGAYEDHDWIGPLEELIRDIRAAGQPLVGVCFGHQIIAQALGGKVEKFAGGWSVGRTEYDFGDEVLALNAWHQDQVTELPEGAEVIASTDFCANAAVIYGDRILTIQPHPEFTADLIAGLIEHRGRGKVPDALLDEAEQQLSTATDNARFAERMAQVLKKGAK